MSGSAMANLFGATVVVYESLAKEYKGDPVRSFIPLFEGVQEHTNDAGTMKQFLCKNNVLYPACVVMDVKLGIRTYLIWSRSAIIQSRDPTFTKGL